MSSEVPLEHNDEQLEAGGADIIEADDDDADSESSDDVEIEVDPTVMEHLMRLEAELESNPNLYDTHIKYIELLRTSNLRVQLRAAHERMSTLFPLSEQLWMEWVNDELAQVESLEDILRIQNLFQKATQDYFSVNLWCSYIEFVADFDPEVSKKTGSGAKKMRELCEQALTAVGLHVNEGAKVWALYRQYEAGMEVEEVQEKNKHVERMRSLYCRQMQVPLEGGQDVYESYKEWEAVLGKEVPQHIIKAFSKAQEALALRRPYEVAVAPGKPADAHLLAAFMAYIKLEKEIGEPARVQCLYERAIATFPVTTELWMQYGRYLEQNLRSIPGLVMDVYGRALRNCYWVGALWARAIRAAARGGPGGVTGAGLEAVLQQQDELYKRAINAGLQDYECYMDVILAHLDGLRHAASMHEQSEMKQAAFKALREAFQEASQLLSSYFKDYLDRSLRLPLYWTHCEAVVMADVGAARKVWEEATLKTGLGKYYETWASYVSMERSLRNTKEARGIFKRAYNRKLEDGGQLALCSDWLRFEREEGSPEDYFAASLKVEPIMEVAAAQAAAAVDASAVEIAKAAAQEAPKLSKEDIARMRQERDPNFKKTEKNKQSAIKDGGLAKAKRSRENDSQIMQEDHGHEEKRQKHEVSAPNEASAMDEDSDPNHSTMGDVPAVNPEVLAPVSSDVQMEGTAEEAAAAAKRFRDERTVFVKGLRMNLRDGELDLFFQPCGGLKEVRLMRDGDGRFRGFAYVEFSTDEGFQRAVALNGSEFHGKTLFVAKSQPPGSGGGGRVGGRGPETGRGRGGRSEGRGGHSQQDSGRGGRGAGRGNWQERNHEGGVGRREEGSGRGSGGRGRGEFDSYNGGRGRGRQQGLGFSERGMGSEEVRTGGHHRHQIELGGEQPSGTAPPMTAAFVPRIVKKTIAGSGDAPKSNDEFRKMLLEKK
ncbi:hypothetical protein CEUSTIGMA_g2278.t1 [Chlamydomonas eustigma]|uniref:RRM domain-containing protein n=1 Tax=Chlamydomonas eustigma TaxID=1157962 RepID=A0A250WW34_9CHLO|nr:hypothetical protein CEUSTIGMA_g2278.t1 [Chlamydomonas eustigma]|eukprot:GAX74832.1 hypothetical protein CEUSTIGMA_g2278.t1 [Chlamydomonas eustigma]